MMPSRAQGQACRGNSMSWDYVSVLSQNKSGRTHACINFMTSSWFTPIDNYCERIGVGFWAEPVNALTSGAFLLAALHAAWVWRKQLRSDWSVLWLIAVAAVVGI